MNQQPQSTHGSSIRESHALGGPLSTFDLPRELQGLRDEPPFRDRDRNAKTLVKADEFRLTVVALKAGATFDESDQRGRVSILVEDGHVDVSVDDGTSAALGARQLAVIDAGHRWSARATEDSSVVLHFTWPVDPGDRGARERELDPGREHGGTAPGALDGPP